MNSLRLPHLWRHLASDEDGAVLPIVALFLVVLLGFAALTVDLGAAWAERRQDQTAADAAAMAAGLQYLSDDDSPSSDELISIVMDYTSRNLANPPTVAEWQGCIDTEKPDEFYISLTDDDGVEYDCISLRQESDAPTRMRVRIPTRNVPTTFARILGQDSIAVSAAAIVEIEWSQLAKVLPFSVPAQPSLEECLGVPPNGHNDGDVAPCEDGSDSGNFGLLDSPWFGAGPPDYPYNTGNECTEADYEARTELNLALGLDHTVKVWPHDGAPPMDVDMKNETTWEGQDTCSAIDDEDPYVLITAQGTETGNAAILSDGMIGLTKAGSFPGKIRQEGGLNDGTTASGEFPDRLSLDGIPLDNVGLWQYLDGSYSGDCDFSDDSVVGRGRTLQLLECLGPGSDEDPSFGMDLIESPRFALVPSLSYTTGNMTGASGYAIVELVPIYIQSTWYDCTNSGVGCLFHPADFVNEAMDVDAAAEWDDTMPMWYSPVFNPGEGDTVPCQSKKGYDPDGEPAGFDCISPTDIVLKGTSAIVLDWDWFPEDAENAVGNNSPYLVQMYR